MRHRPPTRPRTDQCTAASPSMSLPRPGSSSGSPETSSAGSCSSPTTRAHGRANTGPMARWSWTSWRDGRSSPSSGSGCPSPGDRAPGTSRRHTGFDSRTWPVPRRGWTSPGGSTPSAAGRASRSTTTSGLGSRCSRCSWIERSPGRSPAGRSPRSKRWPRRSSTSPNRPTRRISGIGIITAVGTGRDAFRAGLRAARSPVKRIDRFDPSPFRSQVAAQVDDFDPLAWMPPKTARQLDRFSQFGLVAGRMALDDAGLTPGVDGAAHPQRIGIYLGSALGGIAYAEEQHERYLERGIKAVAPNLALAVFGGAAPANLGIALDVRGPILSTANSCASGAVAVGEAMGAIRDGRGDAAIAGGCEIPLSPLAFGAFDIIRALSGGHNEEPDRAARPFDTGRDGFVMGEGAALLMLEAADVAERRGAVPYAEVLGYGATSDAHHMV